MPEDDEEIKEYYGYRVWYSLELHVKPAAPEKVLEVTCACQVGDQLHLNLFITRSIITWFWI